MNIMSVGLASAMGAGGRKRLIFTTMISGDSKMETFEYDRASDASSELQKRLLDIIRGTDWLKIIKDIEK